MKGAEGKCMEENKEKLAIVFSKNQCNKYPMRHRTYLGKDGKPLKMAIVNLPSALYRPDGLDFGEYNGINRNERLAYLNVPWDAVKTDANNESRKYLYLNREEYNIQFKGNISNGNIEKIEPVRVTAKELENIFNWARRRENKKVLKSRLKKINQEKEKRYMQVESKRQYLTKFKDELKDEVLKVYLDSNLVKTSNDILEKKIDQHLKTNNVTAIRNDVEKISKKLGTDNSGVIKRLDKYTNDFVEFEKMNDIAGKIKFNKKKGFGL